MCQNLEIYFSKSDFCVACLLLTISHSFLNSTKSCASEMKIRFHFHSKVCNKRFIYTHTHTHIYIYILGTR
jgi:hypothetical protein